MPIPSALAYENRDVAYAAIAPVYEWLARFVPRAVAQPAHPARAGLRGG